MNLPCRTALLGSCVSFALIASAHATVLETQMESFPSPGALLSFQQYSGNGTLTGVTLEFSDSISAFGLFQNIYRIPLTYIETDGVDVSYNVLPGAPASLLAAGSYDAGHADAVQTFSDVPIGGLQFSDVANGSNSASAIFVSQSDLKGFVGSGSYAFQAQYYQYVIGDPVGGIPASDYTPGNPYTNGYLSVGGAITVTYDGVLPPATSAPEPSTWAMILLGFAGLGLGGAREARRRKRAVGWDRQPDIGQTGSLNVGRRPRSVGARQKRAAPPRNLIGLGSRSRGPTPREKVGVMTRGNRNVRVSKAALLAAALIAGKADVSPALAGEILYAPFDESGGVATAGLYSGDVWLTVSGLGQALADVYSDAFYLRQETGGVTTPNRTDYRDLAVDAAPINGSGSQEASNRIVGPIPAYDPSGVYSFEVNAGATPTHLNFGVDDQIYADNAGAYTIVVGSAPTEVLYAPFDQPGGAETSGTYHGKILVTVSGVGQALADDYSDAFYLLPGPDSGTSTPTRPGFWDLAFGASPILGDGSQEATNALVGALPAYSSDNVYTFELDTGSSIPTHLYFGVDDQIYTDNAGAYTIAITQLGSIPEPSTWVMMVVGLAGLGGAASRRLAATAA